MKQTARLILILGMHRSGTSLAAHAMECFGASLGHRAVWSAPDNPHGFGEDQDILNLNDTFLKAWGESWQATHLPRLDGFPTAGATWMLEQRLEAHPLFALKDPRMCRLLPQWRAVFGDLRADVSVVEVVRHPLEVAASLRQRDQMPPEHALELWADHVHRAFAERDPSWPWVTVGYESLLGEPIAQLSRIGSALDLPLEYEPFIHFLTDRRDQALRHHIADNSLLPPHIAALWEAAKERACLGR